MSEQFDPVNKAKQYNKNKCGIETIEVTRYLGCDLGNAWKYMSRYMFKKKPKEDLEKAVWYLEDFIYNFLYQNDWTLIPEFSFHVPTLVKEYMQKFIDFEERPEVQRMFKHILSIINNEGIIDKELFDYDLKNLLLYAQTLEGIEIVD